MDIDFNNLLKMALENPTEGAVALAALFFTVAGAFKYMPLILGYFLAKTVGVGARAVRSTFGSFRNGLGSGNRRALPVTAAETRKYTPKVGDRWFFPNQNLQVRVAKVSGAFARGPKHLTFSQENETLRDLFGKKRKEWTMEVDDFRSAIIKRSGEPFQAA